MSFILAYSYSLFLVLLNTYCPPPITELPILVTWYNPADGGINCDVDCNTFADSTPVTPQDYGRVGACLPEWLGASVTISGLGTFDCRDTGGAIEVAFNDYYQRWVIHVDLLQAEPPAWNYQLRDWQLDWHPVPYPQWYQETIVANCPLTVARENMLSFNPVNDYANFLHPPTCHATYLTEIPTIC